MKRIRIGLIILCCSAILLVACSAPANSQSSSTSSVASSDSSVQVAESSSAASEATTSETAAADQTAIEYWQPDSPAMRSIVDFVSASVDTNSNGFIPKDDRIAVFDMDGTLYGERFPTYFNDWLFIQRALHDESYQAPDDLKAFAQAWEDKVLKGTPLDDFDAKEREMGPKLYEGLTPDSYADVVRKFKEKPVWGFDGMTYGQAFFQPMVSLVKYLCENDYKVYIVSATYRDAVRTMTEGVLDEYVPADRVIGTDLVYVATGDEAEDSMFYDLEPEDDLVIEGSLFVKNQLTNKATVIQQEIGKVPVLAFGNSTGDFSMATYTCQNDKYDGRAYLLLCDDVDRDYGDPEKAASFKKSCEEHGFYTISEKDEFATLYPEGATMKADPLSLWNDNAPLKEKLVSFVESATDESSANFIPVEDRIATFDFDGTLFCETDPNYFDYTLLAYRVLEDPNYKDKASEFEKSVAAKIVDQNENGTKYDELPVEHGQAVSSAFKGMTINEFYDYVSEFMKTPMPSYEGMVRGGGFYQPMVQVVDYLKSNDFTVYIVSGTDRLIVRGIFNDSTCPIDLPLSQVIGSDETLVGSAQGSEDGLDYTFAQDDQLVLGGDFIIKNLKHNKVSVIQQEIAKQPVLSFGNSSGDFAMANYALSNPTYESMAFQLCCDDLERENGSESKAQSMREECEKNGYVPVSMANDWTTIYGEGVTYTGGKEDVAQAA